jgi:hypothetical protein
VEFIIPYVQVLLENFEEKTQKSKEKMKVEIFAVGQGESHNRK